MLSCVFWASFVLNFQRVTERRNYRDKVQVLLLEEAADLSPQASRRVQQAGNVQHVSPASRHSCHHSCTRILPGSCVYLALRSVALPVRPLTGFSAIASQHAATTLPELFPCANAAQSGLAQTNLASARERNPRTTFATRGLLPLPGFTSFRMAMMSSALMCIAQARTCTYYQHS